MRFIARLVVRLWRSFLRRRLSAELPAGARERKEFRTLAGIL